MKKKSNRGEVDANKDDSDEGLIMDFTDVKKKKKSKKSKKSEWDISVDPVIEESGMKASKKKKEDKETKKRINLNIVEGFEEYTYEFLLTRIVK